MKLQFVLTHNDAHRPTHSQHVLSSSVDPECLACNLSEYIECIGKLFERIAIPTPAAFFGCLQTPSQILISNNTNMFKL